MNPLKAEQLLLKCKGDEIWSIEFCRNAGLPEQWIVDLQDCYESGFDTDQNTIYENQKMVNQYHGVPDLLIAYRLAEVLGINVDRSLASVVGRQARVQALKAELDEI